jgi:hypothetical protein
MKKIIFTMFILLSFIPLQGQSLYINEIITSNTNVITDDDGSYEDWVELYYTGSEAFNLEGYGLSDDVTVPYKWVFPEYWIEPGQHLLIWCSDKNRTDINFPLHTNFKISSGGEVITLTKPNGEVQDSYPAIIIPQNYTYGRQTDGSSILVYFPIPSPGATNNSETGYNEILSQPTFSVDGGFFTQSFNLSISHPDPQVTIVYTLDGSDPDDLNLSGTTYNYKNQYVQIPGQTDGPFLQNNFQSNSYTSQIVIADRTNQPNDLAKMSTTNSNNPTYIPDFSVLKGTVVRARAYKDGALMSPIVTQTYFVFPNGVNTFSTPVVSISLSENKFFDYDNGIFVAGKDFDDWRNANPTTPIEEDFLYTANYSRRGDDTEQVGNLSYFVNGNQVINQNVGFRLHGNFTRTFESKSIRLYARSEYGASTFNYPFFAGNSYSSFKRLILRNSGNDFYRTMYRDALAQQIVKHMRCNIQDYQPTVTFLNGEYWGILNIRERFDKHYFERVYGIGELELDILEDEAEVQEGDSEHYNNMISFVSNNSLANEANYDYIKTQMDTDNYIDYNVVEMYLANQDWPGNNVSYFRKKTATYEPNAPYGQDGRWRWLLFDVDGAFGYYYDNIAFDMLAFATVEDGPEFPNPSWSTLLLRKLLENSTFKTDFINRFADMMNTTFLPERIVAMSNQMKSVIEPEMQRHISRWQSVDNMDDWNFYVSEMENFANQRAPFQRDHIRTKFGISSNITATLNVNDDTNGYVKINTINITSETPGVSANPYPWTGIYFHNIPVTLTAIPLEGYTFSHWSGDVDSTEAQITYTPIGDFSVTANFVPNQEPASEEPIYFWMMDSSIANDTPLTTINSSYEILNDGVLSYQSCLEGYPFDSSHPNWRKGSMERRNSPTDINYIPEANNNLPFASSNMRGIQIKQPFQNEGLENTMIFSFSTVGYKDIVFGFAAKDESAAEGMLLDYSIDGTTWITTGLTNSNLPLTTAYQLFETDFSGIEGVNNNANFKVRIRFYGSNMTVDNGNRVTFNNFSAKGVEMPLGVSEQEKWKIIVYPNPANEVLNVMHQQGEMVYQLITIDGKVIKSGSIENQQINISDLQSGIYLLQLNSEGKSETKKIVKR